MSKDKWCCAQHRRKARESNRMIEDYLQQWGCVPDQVDVVHETCAAAPSVSSKGSDA